jgi:hypothetical protein
VLLSLIILHILQTCDAFGGMSLNSFSYYGVMLVEGRGQTGSKIQEQPNNSLVKSQDDSTGAAGDSAFQQA